MESIDDVDENDEEWEEEEVSEMRRVKWNAQLSKPSSHAGHIHHARPSFYH